MLSDHFPNEKCSSQAYSVGLDYDDVGESTGVDMHAHKVARHEMVLPMDQNDSSLVSGKVADFGQHRVNQGEGLTKLTAGDVHN